MVKQYKLPASNSRLLSIVQFLLAIICYPFILILDRLEKLCELSVSRLSQFREENKKRLLLNDLEFFNSAVTIRQLVWITNTVLDSIKVPKEIIPKLCYSYINLNHFEQVILDFGQNNIGKVLKARDIQSKSRLFKYTPAEDIRAIFQSLASKQLGATRGEGKKLGWGYLESAGNKLNSKKIR